MLIKTIKHKQKTRKLFGRALPLWTRLSNWNTHQADRTMEGGRERGRRAGFWKFSAGYVTQLFDYFVFY